MRKLFTFITLFVTSLLFASAALAQQPLPPGSTGVTQSQTMLNAATAAVYSRTSAATLTITVPAGQVAYITGLDISNCEGATTVTVANPTYITTTGLAGSPQYQVGSGPGTAPGVCSPMSSITFATPLKSQTVGTNVTFVLPTFITNQTVSMNVYYYLGF